MAELPPLEEEPRFGRAMWPELVRTGSTEVNEGASSCAMEEKSSHLTLESLIYMIILFWGQIAGGSPGMSFVLEWV